MTTDTFELASGGDGRIAGNDGTYATARSTSSSSSTSTACRIGQLTAMGVFYVHRSFLRFDTSSIPDSNTITSATLRLKAHTDQSVVDFEIQAVACNWTYPLSADREANYDAALAASVIGTYNTSGGWVVNDWYEIALDVSVISKTGYTYLALRSKRDYDGTQPGTDYEYVYFYAYANGPTNAAELVVVHEAPAVTFKPPRAALGVGW